MTKHIATSKIKAVLFIFLLVLFSGSQSMNAQRLGHSASRGGGSTMSRPASPSRPAPSRTTTQRGAINGGHVKTNDRSFSKPSSSNNRTVSRPSNNATAKPKISNKSSNIGNTRNVSAKRTSNIKSNRGNNIGSNNRIGNNNVNINVRNTNVRASSVRYARPPYRYGGYGYYCHRPYFYHPYTPFFWGPYYHPWGYFVTTLATTAIIVAIINDNDDDDNEEYHYENGTYYLKTEDGFEAVQAPVGAQVPSIPKEAETVAVNETTNNYYYAGAFYEQNAEGYIVVPATAGTIVPNLPEGGEEIKIGEQTYVQFGETYYQPIQVDGKDMYEIVEVKSE